MQFRHGEKPCEILRHQGGFLPPSAGDGRGRQSRFDALPIGEPNRVLRLSPDDAVEDPPEDEKDPSSKKSTKKRDRQRDKKTKPRSTDKPSLVKIRILSKPKKASVYIGDELVGKTPYVIELSKGASKGVRVESIGYHAGYKKISGSRDGTVTFDLKPKSLLSSP